MISMPYIASLDPFVPTQPIMQFITGVRPGFSAFHNALSKYRSSKEAKRKWITFCRRYKAKECERYPLQYDTH